MKTPAWERPSKKLLLQVRGGLIATRGLSFCQACREIGVLHQNARPALTGKWNGQKSQEIRKQLCEMAGVK